MKLLVLLAVLAITLNTVTTCGISEQYTQMTNVDQSPNVHDLDVAAKCVMSSVQEVKDLTSLVEEIVAGDYTGSAVKIYDIVKQSLQLLDNCKSLFCYGPSFAKCEAENPGNQCTLYGAIVYPDCKPGYTNWLCCVCATTCPAGFKDEGLYCAKPSSYGRGAGYPLWEESKCISQNPQGCEKSGALWYPKCKQGFHAVGCCVCSPDCPEGFVDIGVSCQKPSSYGRGVGYPVSVGLQCVQENEVNKLFDTCPLKKNQMKLLRQEIDTKMAQIQENNKQNFPFFPGEMKQLAQLTDAYKEYCMNFNTTSIIE